MPKAPKAPKLPSEALRSLTAKKNAKDLKKFLETDLYPALDCLPATQRTILLDALSKNGKKVEAPHLVEFDTRSRSIDAGIRALKKSVAHDPIDGWEEQGEIMMEVAQELREWLPILWKVGIEMGREHAQVHKSLDFCYSAYDELDSTDSRSEFSDLESVNRLQIKDSKGNVVYSAGYDTLQDAILWIWRELLISALFHCPKDTMAKNLVADLKRRSLTQEILERLDETIGDSNSSQCNSDDFKDLQNAHWTPEMWAVLPKLKVLLARG